MMTRTGDIRLRDALGDSATEADALRDAQWQADRDRAMRGLVGRQYADCEAYRCVYDDAEAEAKGSAAGLVNGLAMVVLLAMGAACLLGILWLCGAPWGGVW